MGDAADVVRALQAATNAGDAEAVLAVLHPEIVFDMTGMPDGRVWHGHAGVVEGWSRWRGAWETYEVTSEGFDERGDRVLALVRVRARSKSHGIDVDARAADVLTVRDGLIVHFAGYFDRDEARRHFES